MDVDFDDDVEEFRNEVRDFLEQNNPAALREMSARLLEAQERALWRPRSNGAWAKLRDLAGETCDG